MDYELNKKKLKKKWKGLGIANSFIFYKVMRDNKDLCLELLRRILPELDISEIEFTDTEHTIEEGFDIRGVRLDAFTKDSDKRVYDIEMQAYNKDDIFKRSRYNQSMVDMELLEKGADYDELNESYVIFICCFDLFNKGRHKYTFRNRCIEDLSIELEDKATRIFLNAGGIMDDVSDELKVFLNFVMGETSDDPFIYDMEKAIARAKLNKNARRGYMTWEMEMRHREHKAAKEAARVAAQEATRVAEEAARVEIEKAAKATEEATKAAEENRLQGLAALVITLKPVLNSFESVYQAVISNDIYKDVTKEQVRSYY